MAAELRPGGARHTGDERLVSLAPRCRPVGHGLRRTTRRNRAAASRHTGLDLISPFYSRRIGLDGEGRPVPVTFGARATHRSTRSSAGALVGRQEGVRPVDGSVFGVGRYVRNLGAMGRLGGLVATRHDQGLPAGASTLNTVVADWFFRPTTSLFARGMVSRSFTEGRGGDGWAAHATVGNYAPWGYIGWLQEYVGPQWEPRSGFRFANDVILTGPGPSSLTCARSGCRSGYGRTRRRVHRRGRPAGPRRGSLHYHRLSGRSGGGPRPDPRDDDTGSSP